jgi:cellulose synthase operon protein C
VNPDSAEAHLARGRYLAAAGNPDDGREEVEKAYELKPDDAAVLQAMASHLAQAEEYDEAKKYLEKGKKLHPKDVSFYQLGAEVEIMKKDYDAAMQQIEDGLKTIGTKEANMLLLVKANLQLNANDLKGVQDTIDLMKKEEFRSEFPDWFTARILLAESKWFQASEALSRLRSRVANARSMGLLNLQEIDYFLGLCYERLGKQEMAYDQYELVVQQNPEHEMAKAGKTRTAAMIGLDNKEEADPWQQALAEELKKPKEQQDWARLDQMLREMAKDRKM